MSLDPLIKKFNEKAPPHHEVRPMKDEADWERASGLCICQECGYFYRDHKIETDPRSVSYDGTFCLTILCDGRRVKL